MTAFPPTSSATITRDEARQRIDSLNARIREHSAAAYDRGVHVDGMGADYAAYERTRDADEAARLRLSAELDSFTDLFLALIEERSRSASALRLIKGGDAS